MKTKSARMKELQELIRQAENYKRLQAEYAKLSPQYKPLREDLMKMRRVQYHLDRALQRRQPEQRCFKVLCDYLLDILLFGEMEEKAALIAEQGKEVVRLEQRISELTASSAGSSHADDGRNGTSADAGRNPGNAGGDAERWREEQHQELSDSVPA